MPCPHHPAAPMRPFTPTRGADAGKLFNSCTQFLGKGALGANVNGYCSFKELATNAVPAPEPAPAAFSGVPAIPTLTVGSPRLQAASTALECAAQIWQGSNAPAETVIEYAIRLYHGMLKPAFRGELPEPSPPMRESPRQFASASDEPLPF